ncbi:hypothetical protein NUW58_g7049 [Xylaria curta]|uniref:Uncharacterized protein n=1 Tax=Xylaria curta TaxID=42375 RepID=A0ACC1NME6_9PEZI|nr:hypothetical protein NUW58_g7049 [Xylaria curta]
MSQSPLAASSATGSVTVPLRFVTNDEYVDSQNKQNYILRRELNLMREAQERTDDKLDSIGDRLDKTSESIDRKFESIDRRFENIDKRFESIDRKFDEFTARQDQFEAVFRNSRLSNPILPVRPVVTFDPVNGRRTPDSLHFPRNAGELYALREMDSSRKRQQLIYLANFYELVPSNDDYVVRNPLDTVARLEMVLGLEEDRFVRFLDLSPPSSQVSLHQVSTHSPTRFGGQYLGRRESSSAR